MTGAVRRSPVITGALADRPPYGEAGRTFIDTDTGTQYRDTGSAWVENPAGPQGPPGPAPASTGTTFVRVVGGVLEDPATVAFGAGAGQVAAGDHTHAGGGISTLRKTADETVNGTAFRDITDLSFAVNPNTDYAFMFYIVFRSTTATGFKFSVAAPSGAVLDFFMTYQTVANSTTIGVATWLQGHWVTSNAMNAATATIAAGVDLVCIITGRVKVGGTGGTLAARVGSESANNDLVVQKGSWGWWF